MSRYRKLPVVIEAIEWNGTDEALLELINWHRHICPIGSGPTLAIPTLEGNMVASLGDYIIKGVAGEVYPCKPDIFEQTYEPYDG